MRNILKKSFVFIMIFAIFVSVCGFSSNHEKVFDEADLFTEDEIADLTELAEDYGEEVKLDIVIYTVDTNMRKTAERIAEDFFDENEFGYEDCDGSGAILLIDMYKRDIYIYCSGIAIAYVNEITEDEILDDIYDCVSDGDYYEGGKEFIKGVYNAAIDFREDSDNDELIENWYNGEYDSYDDIADYIDNLPENNPKEPTFFTYFKNPLICLAVGVVCAAVIVGIMLVGSKTRMTVGNRTYLKEGSLRFPVRNDQYINTTTTSRIIQTSSSSGGSGGGSHSHHSSSGRSHSGGGRKF